MRFFAAAAAVLLSFSWSCHVFVDSKDLYSTSDYDGIPVIDILAWTRPNNEYADTTAADRAAIARAVGKACTEIGFFAVTGHVVNASTIENALKASADFFDLPLITKLSSKTNNEKDYPYGYEHSERLQLGKNGGRIEDALPDLKETYSLGPSNPAAGMPPRRFPVEPPDFQESMEEYFRAMEALSSTLLRIFAVALDLREDWFENKMDHHLSALRILNYFPVDRSTIKPGAIRASAHTDYGALTILRSGGPGLQVKKDDAETDVWIDVPSLPDAFIINIGDMMQRWTNDKWVSTLHRVILPPTEHEKEKVVDRRQAIAYFCNINGDAIVEPIESCRAGRSDTDVNKYPPVTAREYLMTKHLASMAVSANADRDEL